MQTPEPPDQDARDRIASDLGATLFVEAGAGSGKTKALVDRVVALIASGTTELSRIAAITFTEKAGAELRERVRSRLEEQLATGPDGPGAARCRVALEQLDGAALGTLHAFAQRLLTEHPVEAGLPPRVEVLDEVSSSVAFSARWSAFRDRLLADDTLERTVLLLLAGGGKTSALQALAEAFEKNWDLVQEHVPASSPEPPDVLELLRPATAALRALCRQPCDQPDDRLRLRLDEVAAWIDGLDALTDDVDVLEALAAKPPSFKVSRMGKPGAWPCDIGQLRERLADAGPAVLNVRAAVTEACAQRLGSVIRDFTLASAADRQRQGRLEFHDLLVLARSLLSDPVHGATVRRSLQERYDHLLLDEFQDTDPIQIELAVRIAAAHPGEAATGTESWDDVALAPGRLFVVGDPKQSIYRFRRADIKTFLRARRRFEATGGSVVALEANFRTGEPIIDWLNHTFATLMALPPEGDADPAEIQDSQPAYRPLVATREAAPVGPPLAILGREPQDAERADDLRRAEAADVAATVTRAVDEGWAVQEDDGTWRPARLGDIAILVPARTSLPFLEDALTTAGVAFRAETSSLVYASRAVRDLLMVLRAIDDPTNHLHVVAALRTPLLACGDDDLFVYRRGRGGRWNYLAPPPETVPEDDPVRMGLAFLRALHDERHWLSPSELLGRIATERRALELGFAEGRPRDVWRRLRFVIDQARAWSEATGGNLRQYLQWVTAQTAEGARVAESILPESDDDAVRILTIHGAKGLEFPIAIISGMSTKPQHRFAPAEVVFRPDGTVGYSLGAKVRTTEFVEWMPVDEQMALDERIRLLYVACTRARDHLVVSLHRRRRASEPQLRLHTNGELLLRGMGGPEGASDLPDGAGAEGVLLLAPIPAPSPPKPFVQWAAERDAALRAAARPTTVAASALTDEGDPDRGGEPGAAGSDRAVDAVDAADAPGGVGPESTAELDDAADVAGQVAAETEAGLQKRPRDLDLPPWLKGRYGTAVGRAVHGVLQTIDLANGAGLPEALATQCEAEAIGDRLDEVRSLVQHALDSPSVQAAAAAPHWREVYACTPQEGRLLEGYIDLLYRSADGLVVLDYKTAATSDPNELDRRTAGYRLQGASYALTVGAATGEPVTRVVFLFLTPGGPVERDLPNLDGAVAEVRRLIAAGAELVTA
jgi:ATP-dependent exoDNAse (exonuclease V) beta subunit